MVTNWDAVEQEAEAARQEGRIDGLKEAANWLRQQANAETEPKARAAFIEAHNAILSLAEGRA